MALCEPQLDSIRQIKPEESEDQDSKPETSQETTPVQNGIYGNGAPPIPLVVDYRSPVSHFIPPVVDLYSHQPTTSHPIINTAPTEEVRRKRGRPRIDKTSPEYIARHHAKKQQREMEAGSGTGRKRGRPRLDKTSPEYLARRRQRELEALEKKAKRQNRRRNTGATITQGLKTRSNTKLVPITKARARFLRQKIASKKAMATKKRNATNKSIASKRVVKAASRVATSSRMVKRTLSRRRSKRQESMGSSSGESPRVKRKYTRRPGSKPGRPRKEVQPGSEKVKGKRGRPRKIDPNSTNHTHPPRIRVRNNLMPNNSTETITIDSDDDIGSPSESLSLDENLRALRSIHEKYAHLQTNNHTPDIPKSDGTVVEKLEDSSNSDSESESSDSGSSSSSSNSSSSSESSSSSSSEGEGEPPAAPSAPDVAKERRSSSSSLSSVGGAPTPESISESDNESVDKTYQCHICYKWYSTIVTLKIHRRGHQSRSGSSRPPRAPAPRYSCDTCPATFSRREKLLTHQSEVHRGSMTVKCGVCGRGFEDEGELREHDAAHTDLERQGRCSICSMSFTSTELLSRHMTAAHPGPKPVCTLCGKTFHHPHSLTRHMQNHQRQMYRCVVCKASFARADQLAQHLNSHLANYKRLKP